MLGHRVSCSPRPGSFGDWYERGLREAVAECQVGIIAVDCAWESSTWMCIEADELHGSRTAGRLRALFIFNPGEIAVEAPGALRYVENVPRIELANCAQMLGLVAPHD
ncbi:MAG TPA: hypothetical protein VJR89_30090 [Polyangiales bacterium]|nr:hypothetical protein [Polyangiales bacterium]